MFRGLYVCLARKSDYLDCVTGRTHHQAPMCEDFNKDGKCQIFDPKLVWWRRLGQLRRSRVWVVR